MGGGLEGRCVKTVTVRILSVKNHEKELECILCWNVYA